MHTQYYKALGTLVFRAGLISRYYLPLSSPQTGNDTCRTTRVALALERLSERYTS